MEPQNTDWLKYVISQFPEDKTLGSEHLQRIIWLLQGSGLPTRYRYKLSDGPYSDELGIDIYLMSSIDGEPPQTEKYFPDNSPQYKVSRQQRPPIKVSQNIESKIAILNEADEEAVYLASAYSKSRLLGASHESASRIFSSGEKESAAANLLDMIGFHLPEEVY